MFSLFYISFLIAILETGISYTHNVLTYSHLTLVFIYVIYFYLVLGYSTVNLGPQRIRRVSLWRKIGKLFKRQGEHPH